MYSYNSLPIITTSSLDLILDPVWTSIERTETLKIFFAIRQLKSHNEHPQ
jgi:hypothetical protein